MQRKRIALVSNALDPPPDEGIRKCAHELATIFANNGTSVHSIRRNASFATKKLLLSPRLLRKLRQDRVCAIVYVPTQSATPASFLRSAVLQALGGARVVLLALQARHLGRAGRGLVRFVRPDLVLTPSPTMLREAEDSGLDAAYLPLGTDLDRFKPADQARKDELRRTYDLPAERPVVLHVGHARWHRGLDWIARLRADLVRIVVIGRSLGFDRDVVDWLRASGIHVVDDYVPAIEELYQLADVYAFPVRDEQSAIAAPLSVLEAMACNLPVVSTPFGALPRMVSERAGLFFAGDERQFREGIEAALSTPRHEVRTREQVLRHSWAATANEVLRSALSLCGATSISA